MAAAVPSLPCPEIVFGNINDIVERNEDIVNFLLTYHFDSFSYDDKCFVKSLPRPTPKLNRLINTTSKGAHRTFSTAWYEKYDWLTGSEKQNKLYCWPCLLFFEEHHNLDHNSSVWGRLGYDNMKELFRILPKHNNNKIHIYCELKFKMFGKKNVKTVDFTHEESVKKHNETVSHNRVILKRLIDYVLFYGAQKPRHAGYFGGRIPVEDVFKLISKYDSKLEEISQESLLLLDASREIEHKLIDSVCHVVKTHIAEEISNAEYFSWQVDGTTNVSGSSLVSVIFRYCIDGVPVERFFEFLDATAGQQADEMYQLLTVNYDKFNLIEKLVGQSYDGACLLLGQVNCLQEKIKSIAPMALFTHSHAHNLNLILHEACAQFKDCKIFFANINALYIFLSKSPGRMDIFNSMSSKTPIFGYQAYLNFKSRAVFTISNNRKKLISFLENIINADECKADNETFYEAMTLKKHLNNFNFVLLLKIFDLIFTRADFVFSVIQSENTSILFKKSKISNLISTLHSYLDNKNLSRRIYDETIREVGLPPKITLSIKMNHCERIFNAIVNICMYHIRSRFNDLQDLVFFDLLDSDKFKDYKSTFPKAQLDILNKSFPTIFNRNRLENELSVLYNHDGFFGNKTSLLEMSKFLFDNKLQSSLTEISKLFSVILSLASTSTSSESSSTFKKMKLFASDCNCEKRLSNSALISIEKPLIQQMQVNPHFYDKIIDHFAKANTNEIDLIYKDV